LGVAEVTARRFRRYSAADGVPAALTLVPSAPDGWHGSAASVVIWEGLP
jgi:hypothetical protein